MYICNQPSWKFVTFQMSADGLKMAKGKFRFRFHAKSTIISKSGLTRPPAARRTQTKGNPLCPGPQTNWKASERWGPQKTIKIDICALSNRFPAYTSSIPAPPSARKDRSFTVFLPFRPVKTQLKQYWFPSRFTTDEEKKRPTQIFQKPVWQISKVSRSGRWFEAVFRRSVV